MPVHSTIHFGSSLRAFPSAISSAFFPRNLRIQCRLGLHPDRLKTNATSPSCHWVAVVAMPSQPIDYNLLLFLTEKLLGFMSIGWGFATFQAIGDSGGRNVELFCSITKCLAAAHSLNCRLNVSLLSSVEDVLLVGESSVGGSTSGCVPSLGR